MTTWNEMRGANLAAWRKRHGMRQADLAARVGVSRATVGCWERNDRAPSAEQIEALHQVADALAGELRGRLAAQEIDAPSRFEVGEGVGLASKDDATVVTLDMRGAQLVCDDATLADLASDVRARGVDVDAPKLDPYTTTIDWQSWAVDRDGQRGISLRAMVNAGLYSHYRDAVAALRAHGLAFAEIAAEGEHAGRIPSDHLLTLKDAQRLAARAQTETGRRVLDLIIEHHDEFQALLRGDREAHARLADAQPAPETPDDPVMAILAAAAETRRAQLAHEQRLAALEHQMARASAQVADVVEVVEDMREQQLADGEVYVGALADQHGWLTEAGNGYTRAVLRSLELAGAKGHTRQIRRAAHHEGKAYHDVWVISAQGARLWRDQIRPEWEGLAEDGVMTLPGKMRCFVHLRGGGEA